MLQTYTPIIYPISNSSLQVSVKGDVLISQSITPYIQFQITSTQTNFQNFSVMDAPIFTSEGFIISLLLVAVPILSNLFKKHTKTT